MRSLIPWRGTNAVDRIFSDFMDDLAVTGRPPLRPDADFSPRVDVRDLKKEIEVTAELPGLEEKDIHVVLNDDRLTIKGEKKVEKEGGDSERYYVERSYGSFTRSIPLPASVLPDKCEAIFKNGVLKITLQKSKEALTSGREIPIRH